MCLSEKQKIRISKFLSLILRHQPEAIGIELDAGGWVAVDQLLHAMNQNGTNISRDILDDIVSSNPKQRFILSDCGQKIRANQGHSIEVDLGYRAQQPPDYLFHGALQHKLQIILTEGLKKMERHAVHLNEAPAPCRHVAARHGVPTILRIQAGTMFQQGFQFNLTPNHVWLVDHVPPQFIEEEEAWNRSS